MNASPAVEHALLRTGEGGVSKGGGVVTEKQKQRRKKREEAGVGFEEALARLEQIAEQLESGELQLEKAIALAEEGLKLSQFCEKQLTEAEGKIEQLVERMGAVGLEPMKIDAEGEEEEE